MNPRKSLRTVIVKPKGYKIPETTGYFHGFYTDGDMEEGIDVCAVVELEDGTVRVVFAHQVQFTDVEKELV
ncbi:hypothetical protein [Shouchella tritolerans]|uniref:hypothetical protein n=1 Tax=Shouchella tritolerans TaxID=2979466 RepID=UPI0021E976FB|nr:hypothetical protein [Shouchella tritolerans]